MENKTVIPTKNGNGTTAVTKSQNPINTFEGMNSKQIQIQLNGYDEELKSCFTDDKMILRTIQVLSTLIKTNPDIQKCTISSIIACMLKGAELELDFSPQLGHCYLVPYNRNLGTKQNPKWIKECQLQIGYRGMIELVNRGGDATVYAHCIFEGEPYEIEYGDNQRLYHKPDFDIPHTADKLKLAYAVAIRKNGEKTFVVLSKKKIEELRSRSPMQKDGTKGAWLTDYEEMAKAKVYKQICKTLPMKTKYADAVLAENPLKVRGTSLSTLEIEESSYEEAEYTELLQANIDADTENDLRNSLLMDENTENTETKDDNTLFKG